ncbi:MAG: hypothetical protein AB8B71_12550 [Paracoccaceae bacterium]
MQTTTAGHCIQRYERGSQAHRCPVFEQTIQRITELISTGEFNEGVLVHGGASFFGLVVLQQQSNPMHRQHSNPLNTRFVRSSKPIGELPDLGAIYLTVVVDRNDTAFVLMLSDFHL